LAGIVSLNSTKVIQHSTDAAREFEPFPLSAVLDGDPRGRVHWLRTQGSGQATLVAGIFVGQPSSFRYMFETDETFHVIEGEVTITLDSGESATLLAGDIASFPRGAQSTWEITRPLRKFFVLSG
jgi:uncharacterized cupin superfamily protein